MSNNKSSNNGGKNQRCNNQKGSQQRSGNNSNSKQSNSMRGKQGRKDSRAKRINADNERESKFIKQYEKDGMRPKAADAPNDISWYSRNPELLRSAATYPFGEVLGQTIFPGSKFYLMGIMRIEFSFAYGGFANGVNLMADTPNNEKFYPTAINQAGKSMYSFLVHANSRNYTYEYQDLALITAAGTQVFAAIAHLIRAYTFARTYSEKSVYKPDAYLTAMGFKPNDVLDNLGQMWFSINNLIAQTSQIWIPSELPLLKRWIWMVSNIFTDAQSSLAQSYMFVPTGFFQYNETAEQTGGVLEPATYSAGDNWVSLRPCDDTYSVKQWVGTIQHMIDRLVNSEDRGIMFGDILNAYGAERIFAMPPIESNVSLLPVFNAEVLTQIENATATQAECIGLKQDENGVYPMYKLPVATAVSTVSSIAPAHVVLNFHQEVQPSPEQVVVATRLTAAGSYLEKQSYSSATSVANEGDPTYSSSTAGSSNASYVMPLAIGSELVRSISFITKGDGTEGADRQWTMEKPTLLAIRAFTSSASGIFSDGIPGSYLSFDWAPFIYRLKQPSSMTSSGAYAGETLSAFGDYDNYTVLEYSELAKLHQMALMSEFGLPVI